MMRHTALLIASASAAILTSCHREPESDLQGTVSRYGFDYIRIRRSAFETEEGLRGFLLFAGTTDGAASEEYSDELVHLLEHWGEWRFLGILESVASSLCGQALDYLAYEGGLGENGQVWSRFSANYPRLAQVIIDQSKRGQSPASSD